MESVEDGKMVAIAAVFGPTLILKGLVATLISDVGIYLLLGGLCLFFLIILTSTDAPYKRVDTCANSRVQGPRAGILG